MEETSVTGIGKINSKCEERQFLGINHLIGPRWNEEKEKEFNNMKNMIQLLLKITIFSNILFTMFVVSLLIVFFTIR